MGNSCIEVGQCFVVVIFDLCGVKGWGRGGEGERGRGGEGERGRGETHNSTNVILVGDSLVVYMCKMGGKSED